MKRVLSQNEDHEIQSFLILFFLLVGLGVQSLMLLDWYCWGADNNPGKYVCANTINEIPIIQPHHSRHGGFRKEILSK